MSRQFLDRSCRRAPHRQMRAEFGQYDVTALIGEGGMDI